MNDFLDMDLDLDLGENDGKKNNGTSDEMPLDIPKVNTDNIIKVVGVGGGGCNAVNHMYNEGIHDVTFAVCNTDKKALEDSPVPFKLQLGPEGLGAGNRPERAKLAAEESIEQIKKMFSDGTKMAFITAGMGGGTGTGASPIVAKIAKEMDILTVAIVTIPFKWEGARKIDQALDGVDEISKYVDALLVINNQRLYEIYQDRTWEDAFAKSDDTLCNAAKSISEIITMRGRIHLDFQDVKTVLKNGGVAIMSTGYGSGENRVKEALKDALESPLLNQNDVFKSKKILLCISEPGKDGEAPLMMEETIEINEFMDKMQYDSIETKWGLKFDPSLKDKVKITILASGFGMEDIDSDELQEHLENKKKEDLIEQREKQNRREQIYGSDAKNGYVRQNVYYYIFKDQDLDNDNLISSVVSVPTYRRPKKKLEQLENLSRGLIKEETQTQNT